MAYFPEYIDGYIPIIAFFIMGILLSLFLLVLSLWRGPRRPDVAKNAPYECGFEPFQNTRRQFDVRFYLVGILFILFDVEIAFLFPWAVTFGTMGLFGFWSMMIFLGVLTVGFIYEWSKGGLEWE